MPARIRVLHLVKTTEGARWAYRLAQEQVREGLDVHVAGPDGPLRKNYEDAGATFWQLQPALDVTRPGVTSRAVRGIRSLHCKIRPDVVHSHFVQTTLAMRAALRQVYTPRAFQVPGPLHLEHKVSRSLDMLSAGPHDHWIASCGWTARAYLAAGIDADRVHLSRYGLNVAEFLPAAEDVARRLAVSDREAVVGMVAYFYRPRRALFQRRGIKGHEDLIDAVRRCVDQGLNVRLVCVGGAWGKDSGYEESVRRYARERLGERCQFLGTRADVADLYGTFDLAVHPSLSENLGGAPESLLMQVPTITTTVGGFPDLIETGVTGWMVEPGDVVALSSTIIGALSDPGEANRIAATGRIRALEMCDVRNTAKEVVAIYQRMLQ